MDTMYVHVYCKTDKLQTTHMPWLIFFAEVVLHLRSCNNSLFVLYLAEEGNTVSESAEQVEIPSSIATNLIGQNPEPPATSSSELMCERSCEELANLFEELKGLRVVVSNLIDGLQKVVSLPHSEPLF